MLSFGDTTTLGLNIDLEVQASPGNLRVFVQGNSTAVVFSKQKKSELIGEYRWLIDCFRSTLMRQNLVVQPSNQGRINGAESVQSFDSEGM